MKNEGGKAECREVKREKTSDGRQGKFAAKKVQRTQKREESKKEFGVLQPQMDTDQERVFIFFIFIGVHTVESM